MKFYLNINNEWVSPEFDIENDNIMQLNWTFDDLENPADLVGEYSYEFTLPYTSANRRLFKNFEQLDSATDPLNSNVFHPNVLIPYIIQTTNDVISTGEAYLSEMSENGYILALNGSLCTVFQKLLNSGWNVKKSEADDEYYLFNDITGVKLSRTLIQSMWDNDTPTFNLDSTLSDITEVITAVPCYQGLYNDFDSNKQIVWTLWGLKESDLIYGEDNEPIDVGDGLNEWQMQEFRSYEQPFAVYIQKLFAWYALKCSDICDYSLNLDARWFNTTYEYLQNIVYVLGKITNPEPELDPINNSTITENRQLPALPTKGATVAGLSAVTATFNTPAVTVNEGEVVDFTYNLNYYLHYNTEYPNNPYYLCANWENPIAVTAKVIDGNNNIIATYNDAYVLLPDFRNADGEYYMQESFITTTIPSGFSEHYIRYTAMECPSGLNFDIPANIKFVSNYTGTFTINIETHYSNNVPPFQVLAGNVPHPWSFFYGYPAAPQQPTMRVKLDSQYMITPVTRSFQDFTLDKVFGDTNPFTILLKYTKMMGMVWVVDDYNKTITVKRRSDYFYDLINEDNNSKSPHGQRDLYRGFYDITDLVDVESYKITPLAWTTRDVNLNYDDADDIYMSRYKTKYDRTYGSALIKTENYLNKDSEDLFCTGEYDTIAPSCAIQPYYQPYAFVQQNNSMKFQLNVAEPSNMTDGGKPADIKNNFYFRLANVNLPAAMHKYGFKTDENGYYAHITDDTSYEIWNNTFAWHSDTYRVFHDGETDTVVRKVPCFHTLRNGYSVQFAEPFEAYFNIPVAYRTRTDPGLETDIEYIYDREWAGYVNEIYNVENKTLEADVVVNGELYRRLKSVPLVTINDVAYLVTEIQGWSEYNETTRLVLRQIWNYNSLLTNNHSGGYTPTSSNNTDDGSAPVVVKPDIPVIYQSADDIGYDMDGGKGSDELWKVVTGE